MSDVWPRLRAAAPPSARAAGRHLVSGRIVRNIRGRRQYLWRAVDQDGDVLDILVQPRRDRQAAARFFRKLLKGQGREPRRLITDKLRSYAAAHHTVMPSVTHGTRQYENNRAEVSHQPTRQRERQMRRLHPLSPVAPMGKRWSESRPRQAPRISAPTPPGCAGVNVLLEMENRPGVRATVRLGVTLRRRCERRLTG